ncbi:hypothetical protein ABKV49_26965, partial (plasmid) [Enterobacter ludwigii]
ESYLYTDFNTELNKQTNKPICPVAPQPDRDVLITDQAKQVLTSTLIRIYDSNNVLRVRMGLW